MTDCLIIGGGLIGMLTARELQDAGAEVTILDQGKFGGESTWAGGGILSPLYPWRYSDSVNRLASLSQRIYPKLALELLQETGIDPQYLVSGLLVLDTDEYEQARDWANRFEMHLELIDARDQLQGLEPLLAEKYEQGLWMPDIAQLRNPRLIKTLTASLQQRNIDYRDYCRVESLIIEGHKVSGVVANGETILADKVIVTAGAWSGKLLEEFQPPVIEPVKGQMILFRAKPGVLKHIVLHQGYYLIPRKDGRILAGSTLEYTGFEKQTTDTAQQQLESVAKSLLPALGDYPIEHHWAGLRPGTQSGIPYICEHPDVSGLFINSGHFRNGVILGIASVQLLCNLIQGQTPKLDPAPYALDAVH